MGKTKVHTLVSELWAKFAGERSHVQTVKITEQAHARLRALADFADRSKTPLAGDLLMAAIDDAIEALPNEPLDEVTADKLRGVVEKRGVTRFELSGVVYDFPEPRGLRDIVLERAETYVEHDRWQRESVASTEVQPSNSNGVAH